MYLKDAFDISRHGRSRTHREHQSESSTGVYHQVKDVISVTVGYEYCVELFKTKAKCLLSKVR